MCKLPKHLISLIVTLSTQSQIFLSHKIVSLKKTAPQMADDSALFLKQPFLVMLAPP